MLQRTTVCLLGAILVASGCGGSTGDSAEHAVQALPPSTTTLLAGTAPASTAPATTVAPPSTTAPPASTAPPSTTAPPASTAPPSTTAPPASTAPPSTTAPTTTAPERHEEAPHLFDLVVADGEWSAGAEGDPRLATVRSGPGDAYDVAARLTVPRLAIEGTGRWDYDDQEVFWRELDLGLGRTAWVEGDRLEINEAAQIDVFEYPCATEGAAGGPVPISGASGTSGADGPADHVAQIWHWIGGPDCHRLYLALGTAWDYDSGGPLATDVPDGVTVEAFGSWARITVPGLSAARSDAAAEQSENLTSIVARAADGTVVIDLYARQSSLFAAQALRGPARVVVDVLPATGDGSTPAASLELHASSTTLVAWPGPIDAQNPTEVAMPLTVRGYSRWFESSGDVGIQHPDGTPSTATVTGPQVVNPGTGSTWGLTATDYIEVWGTFEFTIDTVEPGEYRLLVGEYSPTGDGSFAGVTIPFRVPAPA